MQKSLLHHLIFKFTDQYYFKLKTLIFDTEVNIG